MKEHKVSVTVKLSIRTRNQAEALQIAQRLIDHHLRGIPHDIVRLETESK